MDNVVISLIGPLFEWGKKLENAEFVGAKMKILKVKGKNWKEKEEEEIRLGEKMNMARSGSNRPIEASIAKILYMKSEEEIATSTTVFESFKMVEK